MSFVFNIAEAKVKRVPPAMEERILVPRDSTANKIVEVRHMIIEPGGMQEIKTPDERLYYVLAGRGVYDYETWGVMGWDCDLEANTAIWQPPVNRHFFCNTGEGPLRLIAVSCKIDGAEKAEGSYQVKRLPALPNMYLVGGDAYVLLSGREVEDLGARSFTRANEFVLINRGCSHPMWENRMAHKGSEEISYFVRGEGKISLGDKELSFKAGSVVYIAPNTPHRFENTGRDVAAYVCWRIKEP